MSKRVIVGLTPQTAVRPVRATLLKAGAEAVRGPTPELPDVLVVTIPNDLDMAEFIRLAQEVAGVDYAEPDSWQFSV